MLAVELELELNGELGLREDSVQASLLYLARGYRRLNKFEKSNCLLANVLEVNFDMGDALQVASCLTFLQLYADNLTSLKQWDEAIKVYMK